MLVKSQQYLRSNILLKISKISTLVGKIPGYSIESVISQLRDYLQQQVGVMILLIVTAGICDRTDIDRMLAKDMIAEAKTEVGEARMKSAEPTET